MTDKGSTIIISRQYSVVSVKGYLLATQELLSTYNYNYNCLIIKIKFSVLTVVSYYFMPKEHA